MTDNEPTGAQEFITWLSWKAATRASRFYPPDLTAKECIKTQAEKGSGDVEDYARGVEHGQHSRAYTEMVDLFDDLEARGFEPRERAEWYIEENDMHEIEWDWYEDSHLGGKEADQDD